MVTIRLSRVDLQYSLEYFFPFIEHLRRSIYAANADKNIRAAEMLLSLVSIAALDSAELKFNQKWLNSSKSLLSIKLDSVESTALYKALLQIPIEKNNFYANMVRNRIIEQIDYAIDIFNLQLIQRFGSAKKSLE
ncbi:MAG TPA: hypothetical protein PLN30_00465 [Ferruginibacter sp.]|nr:hypothetical protein [Ferruginibacter sp.]